MSITYYPIPKKLESATTTTAFGEPIAVPISPVIQLGGIYGLDNRKFQTFTASTGAVSANGVMRCETGTGAYGYGVIRSLRVLRYRPGQGALTRFTAKFSTGTANYTQRAGFFQQEGALQIGYDGTSFGVLQSAGKASIVEFTITAAASGSETVTVTLNGTAYNVAVTSGTINFNTSQLGSATYTGWITSYYGGKIRFVRTSNGPTAGSFSITSTGTLTASAVTSLQTGVTTVDTWTPQSSFNIDKLDGTGPSGMIIDPTKFNVYQIDFRWLGAGIISFALEDQETGTLIYFHRIHYVNQNTTLHMDNPTYRIGYVAADLTGGGGTNVIVEGGSMMGAIEGLITPTSYPVACYGERTTSLSAGQYGHIVTVKNDIINNNKITTSELIIQKISVGATAAASNPCTVFLYLNPTYSVNLQWDSIRESILCSDTDATITHANFVPLAAFAITSGAPTSIDVSDLRIVIPPNNTIGMAIESSGLLQTVQGTITFIED
jgi:hypothetical protein